MNQLNQLQEKLQSSVISLEEQKALKGRRGRIFRGGYSNPSDTQDTGSDHTTVKPTSSGSSTSSPTVISSSNTYVVPDKFGTQKFI